MDKSKGYLDTGKDAAGFGEKGSDSSVHMAAAMDVDKDAHVSSFTGKSEGM